MSTTADALKRALSELAVLRESNRLIAQAIMDARAAFDQTHAEILTAKSETAAKLAESEAQVRALALVVFEQTGEKKAVEGASVVIRTTWTYDTADAIAWAKAKDIDIVDEVLDDKRFRRLLGAMDVPCATKIETPAVQIATDLSDYLNIPEPVTP